MSNGGFTLPKGFKFQPSDEVLLSYYLQKKNQGKDSQITAIMPEIDLCKHEPRDLPALVFTRAEFLDKEWFTMADSPDMEWYFFSPIDFKHSNCKSKSKRSKSKSTKINRTTKEGSWKKQGNDRMITGASSDKQIGGRRILTFYLSENQKTDWVIHEYYLTKADSDEPIGDFFLCRLKDNSSKKKSGKSAHDRQDAPLCDGGGNQASIEPGNVVVSPNGNVDAAEHGGSSCSMALNVEESASKPLEDVLPMPYGDHDDNDHGGGSSHFASGMLTESEDNLLFKQLRDDLFGSNGNEQELGGSQTGSRSIEKSDLSASVEGQTDGYNSPDVEMDVEELLHEPGDLHPSPSPEVLQSPIYTKTGTNSFLDDENRKRKYPFGDSDPCLRKKNHTDEVDNNSLSNSEYQAADPIPEGYSLPSINREPGDLPHDNNFIEWDDLPTITTIEGFESFLPNSDTVIDGGISDRNTEVAYGSVGEDAEALCCCLFWQTTNRS